MKTISTIISLMIILSTSICCESSSSSTLAAEINSASGSNENKEPTEAMDKKAGAGYLSCKMDGVLLEAQSTGLAILYAHAKKEVVIRGSIPTGIISIIIDNVESTGTLTIKGNSNNGAGVMMGTKMYEVKKTGTPFTVTIEAISEITLISAPQAKAIRGTFEGTMMDNEGNIVEITEGKFSTEKH